MRRTLLGTLPLVVAFLYFARENVFTAFDERAFAVLEEMEARGVSPNAVSFGAAISACKPRGLWEKALALLEEMRSEGVAPDAHSYNAAIEERELYDELAECSEDGEVNVHDALAAHVPGFEFQKLDHEILCELH